MTHLVLSYGYLAVFALVALEYLGVPVPGETALIAAAVYAGHTHRLSVWAIYATAAAAAIIGDYLGYLAGRKGGLRLLLRWGPALHLDHAKIKVGWYVFDRHGGKVVFVSRFVTVLRTYAAFLAGVNRMRWLRFSVFNVAGGVAWAAFYTFAAYGAGQALARLSSLITIAGLAAAVVVAVVMTLVMRRGAARLAARAEAAFPGPITAAAGRQRPAPAGVPAREPSLAADQAGGDLR